MKKTLVLLTLTLIALTGCGGGGGGEGGGSSSTKTLTSIAVTPADNRLAVGKTQQFTATGSYSDGSTQNLAASVTWSSSNTAVATVDSNGVVTAVAAGSTTITATSGAISGQTTLTVPSKTLVAITITHPNQAIAAGTFEQFTATGTYSDSSTANLTTSVTWSSSNTTVATINGNGKAAGNVPGQTTITATSGSVTGTATLTVNTNAIISIAVTPTNPNIIAGGSSLQFTAIGTMSDSSTQDLTASVVWTSSIASVATIDSNGKATGVSNGSTTITATYVPTSVSGSTGLTVGTIQSIAVTPANPSVAAGTTQQFTAMGTFSIPSATVDITASVTWSSSNTSVATIDSSGKATAVGTGTATITASAGGKSGSTTLTVTPLNVSGTWTGTYTIYDDPADPSQLGTYNFELVLNQSGTAVTGTATLRGNMPGQTSATGQLTGNVTGRQLDFSFSYYYSPTAHTNVDIGTGYVTATTTAITISGNAIENYNGGYNCSYTFSLTKQP
jgi:uncharacterized protein YjdB